MSIRDMKGTVDDLIPINTVLASVSDKTGLDKLIPALIEMNPGILVLSTGGTYKHLKEIMGSLSYLHLEEVAEYTEFPEMEGGLVKTLHPKIHAGILGERNNPAHQDYLKGVLGNGRFIDLVVVNLYPFKETADKIGLKKLDAYGKLYTFESGRGNIDIGGPTMLRAAAKNFPSCAALCNPLGYDSFLREVTENGGATSFAQRRMLAEEVFLATARYDTAIARFMRRIDTQPDAIRGLYKFR